MARHYINGEIRELTPEEEEREQHAARQAGVQADVAALREHQERFRQQEKSRLQRLEELLIAKGIIKAGDLD